jgi:hypothetical protein
LAFRRYPAQAAGYFLIRSVFSKQPIKPIFR